MISPERPSRLSVNRRQRETDRDYSDDGGRRECHSDEGELSPKVKHRRNSFQGEENLGAGSRSFPASQTEHKAQRRSVSDPSSWSDSESHRMNYRFADFDVDLVGDGFEAESDMTTTTDESGSFVSSEGEQESEGPSSLDVISSFIQRRVSANRRMVQQFLADSKSFKLPKSSDFLSSAVPSVAETAQDAAKRITEGFSVCFGPRKPVEQSAAEKLQTLLPPRDPFSYVSFASPARHPHSGSFSHWSNLKQSGLSDRPPITGHPFAHAGMTLVPKEGSRRRSRINYDIIPSKRSESIIRSDAGVSMYYDLSVRLPVMGALQAPLSVSKVVTMRVGDIRLIIVVDGVGPDREAVVDFTLLAISKRLLDKFQYLYKSTDEEKPVSPLIKALRSFVQPFVRGRQAEEGEPAEESSSWVAKVGKSIFNPFARKCTESVGAGKIEMTGSFSASSREYPGDSDTLCPIDNRSPQQSRFSGRHVPPSSLDSAPPSPPTAQQQSASSKMMLRFMEPFRQKFVERRFSAPRSPTNPLEFYRRDSNSVSSPLSSPSEDRGDQQFSFSPSRPTVSTFLNSSRKPSAGAQDAIINPFPTDLAQVERCSSLPSVDSPARTRRHRTSLAKRFADTVFAKGRLASGDGLAIPRMSRERPPGSIKTMSSGHIPRMSSEIGRPKSSSLASSVDDNHSISNQHLLSPVLPLTSDAVENILFNTLQLVDDELRRKLPTRCSRSGGSVAICLAQQSTSLLGAVHLGNLKVVLGRELPGVVAPINEDQPHSHFDHSSRPTRTRPRFGAVDMTTCHTPRNRSELSRVVAAGARVTKIRSGKGVRRSEAGRPINFTVCQRRRRTRMQVRGGILDAEPIHSDVDDDITVVPRSSSDEMPLGCTAATSFDHGPAERKTSLEAGVKTHRSDYDNDPCEVGRVSKHKEGRFNNAGGTGRKMGFSDSEVSGHENFVYRQLVITFPDRHHTLLSTTRGVGFTSLGEFGVSGFALQLALVLINDVTHCLDFSPVPDVSSVQCSPYQKGFVVLSSASMWVTFDDAQAVIDFIADQLYLNEKTPEEAAGLLIDNVLSFWALTREDSPGDITCVIVQL